MRRNATGRYSTIAYICKGIINERCCSFTSKARLIKQSLIWLDLRRFGQSVKRLKHGGRLRLMVRLDSRLLLCRHSHKETAKAAEIDAKKKEQLTKGKKI